MSMMFIERAVMSMMFICMRVMSIVAMSVYVLIAMAKYALHTLDEARHRNRSPQDQRDSHIGMVEG